MSGSEPLRTEVDGLEDADGRIGSVRKQLAWLAVLLVVVGVGVGLVTLSKSGGGDSPLLPSDGDEDVTGDSPLLLSDGDEDGSGDSFLLLSRRKDDGDGDQYFLIHPGEQPGPENLVDTPDSFKPAFTFVEKLDPDDSVRAFRVPHWGFTENGRYLVGTGSSSDGFLVTAIDTSSGERSDIFVGESWPRVYVAGTGAIVEIENEEATQYLLFDPSSSEGLVDLGPADEVEFSPDGRFVALLSDGTADVFEIPEGRPVLSSGFNDLAFSPDGERLALASDRGIELYDLPAGELRFADDSFVDERTGIYWNAGDAFVVGSRDRGTALITTDGKTYDLSPFEAGGFVSMPSPDLLLFDDDRDLLPAYFSVADDEIVQIDGLAVLETNGMFGFVTVGTSSKGRYSEILDVAPTGNLIKRMTADGVVELLATESDYYFAEALLVGGTNFFVFGSSAEDLSGDELMSRPTGGVKIFSERSGSVVEVFDVSNSEVDLTISDEHLFAKRQDLDSRGDSDEEVTLFLVGSDGVQELGHEGFGMVVAGGTVFYTSHEGGEATVMSADVGAGLAEPYAPGYRLVAAYIGD